MKQTHWILMRRCLVYPAALALLSGNGALAQDVDNGRRIYERSCVSCHAIEMPTKRQARVIPFAAIAAKPAVSADVIASFLLMPHVTMPGLRLERSDAQDVAAFIMSLKK